MSSTLSLVLVSMQTVGKIVLAAGGGVVVSRYFAAPTRSMKGMTHISVRLLLPCLLFANLCLGVTWSSLSVYYWAPLLTMLPMLLGYAASLACRPLLDTEWHAILTLGCTFQNGLMYPLTVLLNLKGIAWLDEAGLLEAQRMMFLYNIPASCGLWAIGETIVRTRRLALDAAEAAATAAAEATAHAVALPHATTTTTTTAPAATAMTTSVGSFGRVRLVSPSRAAQPSPSPRHRMLLVLWRSLQSPPVASSLLAIAISLTPPLRWVAAQMPGTLLLGGLRLLGQACIPLQLLLLGCSLTSANSLPRRTTSHTAATRSSTAQTQQQQGDQNALAVCAAVDAATPVHGGVQLLLQRVPHVARFTALTCVLRLLLVPAVSILVVHGLHYASLLPPNRPFFLALLVGLSSPSAINSSLICSMYNYHAREYARMIFLQYLCAICTATLWLIFALWYIDVYVPDAY